MIISAAAGGEVLHVLNGPETRGPGGGGLKLTNELGKSKTPLITRRWREKKAGPGL